MNQITALKDIMNKSRIIGTGSYLPERVLTNNDLTKLVDTSDKWIIERTGIRQRHIAAENETTADIAYQSSLRALKSADTSVKDMTLLCSLQLLQTTLFLRPQQKFKQCWA